MLITRCISTSQTEHVRERTIDGEQVLEAFTEEGFAAALDASLSTGIPIAASSDLAARFGLVDHTDDSAEVADLLPPGAQVL